MLEELRKKPRAIRSLYAFWGAVLLTSLIGGVWLLATVVKFSTNTETNEGITNTTSALSQFLDQLRRGFNEKTNDAPAATSTETKATTKLPKNPSSATSSSNYPPILVATTTSPKVQIGTSSPVAE